jgi:hypothetical protein
MYRSIMSEVSTTVRHSTRRERRRQSVCVKRNGTLALRDPDSASSRSEILGRASRDRSSAPVKAYVSVMRIREVRHG